MRNRNNIGDLLERNSFFLKLSKSKLAFILIVIVFISSIIVNNYFHSVSAPFIYIEATKLDEEPEKYFSLINPESYGIQTIFDESTNVKINFKVFSDIMLSNQVYGTTTEENDYYIMIVEYDNNYYKLKFVPANIYPPITLSLISIITSIISITTISLMFIIFIYKITAYFIPK